MKSHMTDIEQNSALKLQRRKDRLKEIYLGPNLENYFYLIFQSISPLCPSPCTVLAWQPRMYLKCLPSLPKMIAFISGLGLLLFDPITP